MHGLIDRLKESPDQSLAWLFLAEVGFMLALIVIGWTTSVVAEIKTSPRRRSASRRKPKIGRTKKTK